MESSLKLQSEILRILRGKLTASAASAKLGYKFNQYARWEKGERRLMWTDFVAICILRGLPIQEQVRTYYGFNGDISDTRRLSKILLNGQSIDDVSRATKLSRSKISRWINGKASPTFADVYTLMGLGVNTLSFFERILPLDKVPSLAPKYAMFKQQRELAYALPHLDALLEALIVRKYEDLPKHDAKVLAKIAGLSVETVNRSLSALEKIKMLELENGKYKSIEIGIDYRADKKRMTKILSHWLRQTAGLVEKMDKSFEGALVGFSVFSLSNEGYEKMSALLRDFVRGVHTIGSEDRGPKEKVMVFTTSLVDAEKFST